MRRALHGFLKYSVGHNKKYECERLYNSLYNLCSACDVLHVLWDCGNAISTIITRPNHSPYSTLHKTQGWPGYYCNDVIAGTVHEEPPSFSDAVYVQHTVTLTFHLDFRVALISGATSAADYCVLKIMFCKLKYVLRMAIKNCMCKVEMSIRALLTALAVHTVSYAYRVIKQDFCNADC